MFTQLNQYHLVLETLPEFRKPVKLQDIYVPATGGGRGAAQRVQPF